MRMAVVGSRVWSNAAVLDAMLDWIAAVVPITLVVSGGAAGADSLAEVWARSRGLPLRIYRADWNKDGRSAGFKRNTEIAEGCDFVVAFWDGRSRGTLDTLAKAADKVRVVIEERLVCVLPPGERFVPEKYDPSNKNS